MAIAALLLWVCTAAAGTYLLATSARGPRPGQVPRTGPPAARPVRERDRFDPPSLVRAKNEPLPGLRALAEFAHPALAITGLGFWLGYVLTRDRVFAAIGAGVLLGAIGAGLSWFAVNRRAARAGKDALSPSSALLILHAVGAALTLLVAIAILARA